jgi:dTDP-4-dehydrorhamnose 3,5-epimerase
MKLEAMAVAGVFRIALEPIADARGSFARSYCFDTLRRAGSQFGAIRQMSLSFNPTRHTLRGLHYQSLDQPEGKIVRVTRGRVFDVVLDLRCPSPTYLRWCQAELGADTQDALLIPPGCAHGFLTLEDDTTVEYAMDANFDAGLARGCRWNDPRFGITWPVEPRLIGERDRSWPDFQG